MISIKCDACHAEIENANEVMLSLKSDRGSFDFCAGCLRDRAAELLDQIRPVPELSIIR